MNFDGKVAIITGGARGIGRAYSEELLNLGMQVCICDIEEGAAKEFIENLSATLKNNVIFQKLDVTSFTDFKDVFDKVISKYGRVDLVINNAGICDEDNWRKAIDVNLIGVIYGMKLAFEYMGIDKGGSGGRVITTASEQGLDPSPLSPVYSATKHAVIGLTKGYGSDYHFQKTRVTFNAICPGPVDTELFHAYPDCCVDKTVGEQFIAGLKKVKPEEMGKALLKLLKDDKNGALLRADMNGIRYA